MILLIAIPIVGFLIFSGIQPDNDVANSAGAVTSDANEPQEGKGTRTIDRIAAFNPAAAENIQRTKVKGKLQNLKTMLYMHGVEGGEPSSNEQGLQALVDKGALRQADIIDEWGNTFVYRMEWGKKTLMGKEYSIFIHSKGKDGISGNADDVMMP